MWFTDVFMNNANEVCFSAAMAVSFLFYYQYKKYEAEVENEEMIENFLNS
ncbi:MAG: hypothetical protein ACXWWD_10115 [Chitinophagaceae bacterium]